MNGEQPKPEARTPDQGITCKHGLPHGHPCSQCGAEAIEARTSKTLRAEHYATDREWAIALTAEIERLTRERDHYKSEADNLRGLWNDPNHLVLLEGRENAAKGYAPKRSAPETSERCHFRAFGRFACELPKDHAGDHTCRLPEDPLPQSPAAQSSVDEQVFQDILIYGLGFTMHAPAGRRRVPPDAVTIDLDKLHASEQPLNGNGN